MKPSSQDRVSSSPDVSTYPSVNDQSKHDQARDCKIDSSSEDLLTKKAYCGIQHGIDPILIRKVLAEAVGSFILMFCICGIIANMQLMGIEGGLMEYAVTAALAATVLVFSTGAISGAHVNPAVTIAFATVGPFPWSKVPVYIVAQVGGSALATYVGKLIYGIKSEFMMTTPLHGRTAAFSVEFIASFIILFLVASLSHDPKSVNQLPGFIVGVAIGLGVLITGYMLTFCVCINLCAYNVLKRPNLMPVSGASLNPARSLGPALVSWNFDYIWIYLTAPTMGAVAGATLYRALRLQGWSCNPSASPDTHALSHTSYRANALNQLA